MRRNVETQPVRLTLQLGLDFLKTLGGIRGENKRGKNRYGFGKGKCDVDTVALFQFIRKFKA